MEWKVVDPLVLQKNSRQDFKIIISYHRFGLVFKSQRTFATKHIYNHVLLKLFLKETFLLLFPVLLFFNCLEVSVYHS